MPKYQDETLESFSVPSIDGGYNAYPQSKTMVADGEIPYGQNVQVDETFTGITKIGGSKRVSTAISGTDPVKHVHIHRTSNGEEVIAISGTTVAKVKPTQANITGVTPTANLDYMSFQGGNKSYFLNGTDNPFNYDGSSLATISTNLPTNGLGMIGIYYARRAYVVDKINKDQINFSGMYSPENSKDNLMNFTTTDPVYGGYFRIKPGAGIEVSAIYEGTDGLYIGTKQGEIYKCVPTDNTGITNAQTHSVQLVVKGVGISSPFSPVQAGSDIQFSFNKGWQSYGYQQLYGNLQKPSLLSKRIKPELSTTKYPNKIAAAFFNDAVYIAYGSGEFNNRAFKLSFKDRNYQLAAWSCPIVGWNVTKFIVYTDSDNVQHLYGGASNESYVYEYDTGLSNNGVAINAIVEFRSTDCKKPGLVKRFAFRDVFYSMVYGALNYQQLLDETIAVEDTKQLGNSGSLGAGCGSLPSGSKMSGANYDPNTTFASLKQNGKLRIKCNFKKGSVVTTRFSNNNVDENFKINGYVDYFISGSIYES